MTPRSLLLSLGLAVLMISLGACHRHIPRQEILLTPESLQQRQVQSRYFDTGDEAAILAASAGVLQDLGFNIDESETDLGLIVGSKWRDARETDQIVGAVLMKLFLFRDVAVDKEQKIRASLVTRPVGARGERIAVRVTFQRTVWNDKGEISRSEGVAQPEIYQEFFDLLSKSAFLQANLS